MLKTLYGCLLMIGMAAEIAVWSILRPWGCPDDSLLVSSAVCMTGHCHTNLQSTITARDIWCLKLCMVVCWWWDWMLELQFGPYSGSEAAPMTHCWFPASAVGQPKTLPHQFGIHNHCQRHLMLKTLYGCLLMIGMAAEIAVWSIFWLWGCPDDSLLVSSAVCMTGHCHTNLESTITARTIWCLKLCMAVY
jgi:hypothetical protein